MCGRLMPPAITRRADVRARRPEARFDRLGQSRKRRFRTDIDLHVPGLHDQAADRTCNHSCRPDAGLPFLLEAAAALST